MPRVLKVVSDNVKITSKKERFRIITKEKNEIEIAANKVYSIIIFSDVLISSSALSLATKYEIPVLFVSLEKNQLAFLDDLSNFHPSEINMAVTKRYVLDNQNIDSMLIENYLLLLNSVIEKLFGGEYATFSYPFDIALRDAIDQITKKYIRLIATLVNLSENQIEESILIGRYILSLEITSFLLRNQINPALQVGTYYAFFNLPLLSAITAVFSPLFIDIWILRNINSLINTSLSKYIKLIDKFFKMAITMHENRKTFSIRRLLFNNVKALVNALRAPLLSYKFSNEVIVQFLSSL